MLNICTLRIHLQRFDIDLNYGGRLLHLGHETIDRCDSDRCEGSRFSYGTNLHSNRSVHVRQRQLIAPV